MRILVFGSRDWTDVGFLECALDYLHMVRGITCLIHGACHLGGADIMAGDWAKMMCIPVEEYPVDTARDGPWPGAGPIRNARMLADSNPEGGVMFPTDPANVSKGTAGMLRLCKNRKPMPLKVWDPTRETIGGRGYEPQPYPQQPPAQYRGL